jgi:hypothetical protein
VIAQKILLAMLFHLGKTRGHEVCSCIHPHFDCVCLAGICGFATALSGKTVAALWQ